MLTDVPTAELVVVVVVVGADWWWLVLVAVAASEEPPSCMVGDEEADEAGEWLAEWLAEVEHEEDDEDDEEDEEEDEEDEDEEDELEPETKATIEAQLGDSWLIEGEHNEDEDEALDDDVDEEELTEDRLRWLEPAAARLPTSLSTTWPPPGASGPNCSDEDAGELDNDGLGAGLVVELVVWLGDGLLSGEPSARDGAADWRLAPGDDDDSPPLWLLTGLIMRQDDSELSFCLLLADRLVSKPSWPTATGAGLSLVVELMLLPFDAVWLSNFVRLNVGG